jgi:beta-glucanase (GH16 family)
VFPLAGGYHIYGLKWIPGVSLTWYVDGVQIGQVTSARAVIPDEPMQIIMSLQVANKGSKRQFLH